MRTVWAGDEAWFSRTVCNLIYCCIIFKLIVIDS